MQSEGINKRVTRSTIDVKLKIYKIQKSKNLILKN